MVPIMGKGWSYSLNEANTCVAADIVAPGVLAVDLKFSSQCSTPIICK